MGSLQGDTEEDSNAHTTAVHKKKKKEKKKKSLHKKLCGMATLTMRVHWLEQDSNSILFVSSAEIQSLQPIERCVMNSKQGQCDGKENDNSLTGN